MVQSDENIAYRFGGFDFGFTPDGRKAIARPTRASVWI
jgi:hypothetical protein